MQANLQCPRLISFWLHISAQFSAPSSRHLRLTLTPFFFYCYWLSATCWFSLSHSYYILITMTPSSPFPFSLPLSCPSVALWPPPPFALSLHTSWLGTISLRAAPQSSLLLRGMQPVPSLHLFLLAFLSNSLVSPACVRADISKSL